jgi:type IV secretion system protein VirB5
MNALLEVPRRLRCCALILGIGLAGAARAQIPVTVTSDVPAMINQIETIAKWAEQLSAMQQQLGQLRQLYGTLQGVRNLGSLMNDELLVQYLPTDYADAVRALRDGSGSLAGISGSLDDIVRSAQLRSCVELHADPVMRTRCTDSWRQLALQKHIGDAGYRKAADNIRRLQDFVRSVNGSTDQKAISELQARIQIETVRMQNEQIKLSTIQAMEEADRRLRQQSAVDGFNAGLARGAAAGIRF